MEMTEEQAFNLMVDEAVRVIIRKLVWEMIYEQIDTYENGAGI